MCGIYVIFTDSEYREIQKIVHDINQKPPPISRNAEEICIGIEAVNRIYGIMKQLDVCVTHEWWQFININPF